MKLNKLNPWNWFKHESDESGRHQVPVKRGEQTAVNRVDTADSLWQLHREMDRLFDNAFRSFGVPDLNRRMNELFEPLESMTAFFKPSVDVSGDDQQYQIKLDLPGLTEKDVDIELRDRVLTIKGQTEDKSETEDKHFYRVERHCGTFQRTLTLPDDAAADDIQAGMKDGVLTLSIPRLDAALTRDDVKRVEITS